MEVRTASGPAFSSSAAPWVPARHGYGVGGGGAALEDVVRRVADFEQAPAPPRRVGEHVARHLRAGAAAAGVLARRDVVDRGAPHAATSRSAIACGKPVPTATNMPAAPEVVTGRDRSGHRAHATAASSPQARRKPESTSSG